MAYLPKWGLLPLGAIPLNFHLLVEKGLTTGLWGFFHLMFFGMSRWRFTLLSELLLGPSSVAPAKAIPEGQASHVPKVACSATALPSAARLPRLRASPLEENAAMATKAQATKAAAEGDRLADCKEMVDGDAAGVPAPRSTTAPAGKPSASLGGGTATNDSTGDAYRTMAQARNTARSGLMPGSICRCTMAAPNSGKAPAHARSRATG